VGDVASRRMSPLDFIELGREENATSILESGSSSRECRVDTSLTGLVLKTLASGTSGRLVMRNLSGEECRAPVVVEIAFIRVVRSSWIRHSSSPSMMKTVGYVTP